MKRQVLIGQWIPRGYHVEKKGGLKTYRTPEVSLCFRKSIIWMITFHSQAKPLLRVRPTAAEQAAPVPHTGSNQTEKSLS